MDRCEQSVWLFPVVEQSIQTSRQHRFVAVIVFETKRSEGFVLLRFKRNGMESLEWKELLYSARPQIAAVVCSPIEHRPCILSPPRENTEISLLHS